MSKVSSKFQVTLPRELARAHRIEPGEEVFFEDAGSAIYLRRGKFEAGSAAGRQGNRLKHYDAAVERQSARDAARPVETGPPRERGWTRDELYQR